MKTKKNLNVVMAALIAVIFSTLAGCTTDPGGGAVEQEPGNSLAESLARLSENAEEGGAYTITVNTDEAIAPASLSYGEKNVSITLLGGAAKRTVSLSETGALFTVERGVTLTLGNNVTLRGRSDNTDHLVRVNGGTLVMEDGSEISGNTTSDSDHDGSGVLVTGGGTFTMSGGTINGNTTSRWGGGVRVDGGTFTMNGGTISGNSGAWGGGAMWVGDSTFTMNGGTISGNSGEWGGGVWIDNGGTFTMNDGKIAGNTTPDGAGGVHIHSGGIFTMNGGEIAENTIVGAGGGVYVEGTFTMSGGSISGNTTTHNLADGGGVKVNNGGTFTKTGGVIYGSDAEAALKNTAGNGNGHAVYVGNGKIRNTTAGPDVNLDSAKSGAAGGWE